MCIDGFDEEEGDADSQVVRVGRGRHVERVCVTSDMTPTQQSPNDE